MQKFKKLWSARTAQSGQWSERSSDTVEQTNEIQWNKSTLDWNNYVSPHDILD